MKDERYTHLDHENRENDLYASYKYNLAANYLVKYGLNKNHKILNIGCGAADFNIQMKKLGYLCDGFDEDKAVIKFAKEKLETDGLRLETSDMVEAKSIFVDYDFYVCQDVLEHIKDDKLALTQITEIMGLKGRILVITVPAFNFLFGTHDVKLGHFRRYNKKSLIKLVENEFEVLNCRYAGFLGFFAALIFSKLMGKGYPTQQGRLGKIVVKLNIFFETLIGTPFGSSLILVGRLK